MHDGQIDVSATTARLLIRDQFPPLSDMPVTKVVSTGTDNTIFRIGDGLAARFPLRPGNLSELNEVLHAERGAAARMAVSCPVLVPETVGVGEPGRDYPLPWTVQTWIPGDTATSTSHASSYHLAEDLGGLVLALRGSDTRGESFHGTNRGGQLPVHDDWVETSLRESRHLLDTGLLRDFWARFRGCPPAART